MMLAPPNVEAVAIAYLKAKFAEVGKADLVVATNVPATRPPELLRVTATGGVIRDRVVCEAALAVEAWAATPVAAGNLARLAFAFLSDMAGASLGDSYVYACVPRIPSSFPDPDTRTPRYLFTVILTLRATRL